MTVMETETVLKVMLVIFVQMDTSEKLTESVNFLHQFAVLDIKVMETETASHIQWQQFVQMDLKVTETVIASRLLQLLKDHLQKILKEIKHK